MIQKLQAKDRWFGLITISGIIYTYYIDILYLSVKCISNSFKTILIAKSLYTT